MPRRIGLGAHCDRHYSSEIGVNFWSSQFREPENDACWILYSYVLLSMRRVSTGGVDATRDHGGKLTHVTSLTAPDRTKSPDRCHSPDPSSAARLRTSPAINFTDPKAPSKNGRQHDQAGAADIHGAYQGPEDRLPGMFPRAQLTTQWGVVVERKLCKLTGINGYSSLTATRTFSPPAGRTDESSRASLSRSCD